jgi:cobalt/nickel transport system permease protein
MHIPDGYLGPKTYISAYAAMVPLWYAGSRILKNKLQSKQIPFLAMAASFSFIIMMFNIPIPGGSTGHAVGGALIAILLGPWTALFSVSMALIIQALLFGDGGLTAIGANCFNMAFIMPFTAWLIYKMMSGFGSKKGWKILSASVSGYISLNVAALFTAILFGIQPILEKSSDGTPLYCPYGLSVTIPVMMFEHLLIFGFIEAIATGLIFAYILKNESQFLKEFGFGKF